LPSLDVTVYACITPPLVKIYATETVVNWRTTLESHNEYFSIGGKPMPFAGSGPRGAQPTVSGSGIPVIPIAADRLAIERSAQQASSILERGRWLYELRARADA
jgi:hypothetical protein